MTEVGGILSHAHRKRRTLGEALEDLQRAVRRPVVADDEFEGE
jgi:hypothetical protein